MVLTRRVVHVTSMAGARFILDNHCVQIIWWWSTSWIPMSLGWTGSHNECILAAYWVHQISLAHVLEKSCLGAADSHGAVKLDGIMTSILQTMCHHDCLGQDRFIKWSSDSLIYRILNIAHDLRYEHIYPLSCKIAQCSRPSLNKPISVIPTNPQHIPSQ